MSAHHFILSVLVRCALFVPILCDDITLDVFGKVDNQYFPAAFGDFNADKLTDMFVIEKAMNGSNIVKVLLSYSDSPFLRPSDLQCALDVHVKSVVPSDFDGDGAMDILVVSFQEDSSTYNCYILYGDVDSLLCPINYVSIASLKSQPLLLDYNGDMIADLFGEGSDGSRSFWIFNSERKKPLRIPMTPIDDSVPLTPLKLSGGHAFIDIDEDLAADLWVSAEDRFEFWPSSDNFESFEVIDYPDVNPKVIGQCSFFDVELDGNIEVVLPICLDSACAQSSLYVYKFTNISAQWHDLKVNLKDKNEVEWRFASGQSYLYTNIVTPRSGDLNLDGYPDILITVFNGNTPKVIPLINSPCTVSDCVYSRTFVPVWDTFDSWPNSVLGTFFDFLEDGTLDVLLVNSSSDGKTYTVGAYKDSDGYDAMFLKVLVLTGVCYDDCPGKGIPYGTNLPGPSITYTMTSADGGIQKTRSTQMSQSGHFALQLPYSMLGLGRNWNFIDELHVGIPLARPSGSIGNFSDDAFPSRLYTVRKSTFTQIIPNSQLVVIPYPKDVPSLWITKLFITPSNAMLQTAGALIATCLFVAAIIGVLHFREKQQDKQERRQQAQKFHFDAM